MNIRAIKKCWIFAPFHALGRITYWEAIHWICHTWLDMEQNTLKKYIIVRRHWHQWMSTLLTLVVKKDNFILKAKIQILICFQELLWEDLIWTIHTQILEQILHTLNLQHTSMHPLWVFWPTSIHIHPKLFGLSFSNQTLS